LPREVATEFLSNEAGRPCLNGTMSFAFYRTSKPAFRILHHPEQTQDPIPNTHRFIAMLGKRTGATIAAIVTATESAAFRPWLSRRCRPQDAWSESHFRAPTGTGLSHQGWQGSIRNCRPHPAGGLMQCERDLAMVERRPKRSLKMRSRSCAVSISGGFDHAGKVSSGSRPPFI
jgi:hypothetical protein